MTPTWFIEEAGQGFPLVLLHGLGASSFSWRGNLGPLSRRLRVRAPDLPGHGRTPAGVVPDFRLETLTAALLVLLDSRGVERAVLAGNSLGGSLALLLAREQPDRFPALALLDPAAFLQRTPRLFYPLRLPLLGWVAAALLGPWVVRPALHQAYHRKELISPEVVAGYAPTFRLLANRLAIRRLVCRIKDWPLSRVEALVGGITQPVCLIWGREDRVLPLDQGLRLKDHLPQAELHILPGVGHAPQEEAPELVNHLIADFLGRTLQF